MITIKKLVKTFLEYPFIPILTKLTCAYLVLVCNSKNILKNLQKSSMYVTDSCIMEGSIKVKNIEMSNWNILDFDCNKLWIMREVIQYHEFRSSDLYRIYISQKNHHCSGKSSQNGGCKIDLLD